MEAWQLAGCYFFGFGLNGCPQFWRYQLGAQIKITKNKQINKYKLVLMRCILTVCILYVEI